jgi:ribosomal protein S18 acetylase RimI-like enzyme
MTAHGPCLSCLAAALARRRGSANFSSAEMAAHQLQTVVPAARSRRRRIEGVLCGLMSVDTGPSSEAEPTFALRPMTHADLPGVAVVESVAYPGALLEGEKVLGMHRATYPGGCTVAEVTGTGELAGYILSGPARLADCPLEIESTQRSEGDSGAPASANGTAETVYLHDISVRPEFRRCGLGRRLLATVEVLAEEISAPSITLTAVAGAWDHWARLGFAELARKSNAEVSPAGLLSVTAVERLTSYPTEAVFMRRWVAPSHNGMHAKPER